MKMKKILTLLLAGIMLFSLSACSGGNTETESSSTDSTQNIAGEIPEPVTDSPEETPEAEPSETSEAEAELSEMPEVETEDSRILVAYFSATGNTESAAEKLADRLGADLYEIVPEIPYTSDDLNYSDSNSRSSIEMNDPDARPAISGSVENMEEYDVVLLGYPIWWGEAPRIMSTFIESYDFSGKTLAAFCTSASSGFGSSDSALRQAADASTWFDGIRFSGSASAEEILEWANGLGSAEHKGEPYEAVKTDRKTDCRSCHARPSAAFNGRNTDRAGNT